MQNTAFITDSDHNVTWCMQHTWNVVRVNPWPTARFLTYTLSWEWVPSKYLHSHCLVTAVLLMLHNTASCRMVHPLSMVILTWSMHHTQNVARVNPCLNDMFLARRMRCWWVPIESLKSRCLVAVCFRCCTIRHNAEEYIFSCWKTRFRQCTRKNSG